MYDLNVSRYLGQLEDYLAGKKYKLLFRNMKVESVENADVMIGGAPRKKDVTYIKYSGVEITQDKKHPGFAEDYKVVLGSGYVYCLKHYKVRWYDQYNQSFEFNEAGEHFIGLYEQAIRNGPVRPQAAIMQGVRPQAAVMQGVRPQAAVMQGVRPQAAIKQEEESAHLVEAGSRAAVKQKEECGHSQEARVRIDNLVNPERKRKVCGM